MSETVANYGVKVGFDINKTLADLRKLKSELKNINGMSSKLNLQQRSLKGMGRPASINSAINKPIAEPMKQSTPKKTVDKSLNDQKLLDRAIQARLKKEEARQNALWNIEAKRIRAQEVAANKLQNAKNRVMDSGWMATAGASSAKREAQQRVRAQVALAGSAREVGNILTKEKALLKMTQKRSFLMDRMNSSSRQMMGNMISAFAITAGATFITKTGQDFEAVSNTMLAVSANSKEAKTNLKFVREEAFRLGLGLKESAKGFAKMAASRGEMSLGDTKKAFTGISEMSTLLGLSSEESSRAINALMQIDGLAS